MIKKISVKQLKPGVFVHDFNSGWLHHPFLRNQVKLATDADIEKIIRHQIREVYIDTDRGLDVDDAPTQQEVTRGIQSEINHLHKLAVKSASQVSLKEEFAGAKLLISEVQQSTKRLMEDVRLGKPVDFEKTTTIVDKMTHSIMRNKDALISLARIKTKDEYTYMHSVAVSALCIVFAHQSGFGAKEVKQIGVGGMLHDIGKVKIPSEILNKPGPLTEQEFEIIIAVLIS